MTIRSSHYSLISFNTLLVVAILSISSAPALALSAGLDHWNLRNPSRMPYQLWSVCYGNGSFVAAGNAGTLLSSPDGINWQTCNFNPTNMVTLVTFANNQFLASLNTSYLMASVDGLTWDSWPVNIAGALYQIVYGDGLYLGIDFYGNVYTSTDAHTWAQQPDCGCNSDSGTVFAQGKFVFPCGDAIFTSTNGIDWPATQYSSSRMRAVTYGNGLFVAVGYGSTIFTSYDGFSWHPQNAGTYISFERITFGNGQFLALANDKILTSTNGTNWSQPILPVNQNEFRSLSAAAAGDGKFVIVCDSGRIFISTNATDWVCHDPASTKYYLGGVAYGNGVLCTGSGLISQDALNWQPSNRPQDSSDIIFADSRFVSVGPGIWTSLDGVNWSNPVPRQLTGIYSVGYGNNLFVAGGAEAFTSTNGLDWLLCSTTCHADALTYGNGTFAALSGRQVYTSTNGTLWLPHNLSSSHQLNDIAFGAGVFVIVGDYATMLVSSNAIDWLQLDPTPFQVKSLKAITYGQGILVCVGTSGTIFTSTNGLSWQKRDSGTVLELNGVCYADKTFLVAGQNGLIMQSDPLLQLGILRSPNSSIRLRIFCDLPGGCWLESSPDLATWEHVGTTKIQDRISELPLNPASSSQYYRLK